jgi:hypothetical protein
MAACKKKFWRILIVTQCGQLPLPVTDIWQTAMSEFYQPLDLIYADLPKVL